MKHIRAIWPILAMTLTVALGLAMVCCEPDKNKPSIDGQQWILVGETPSLSEHQHGTGIYKRHDAKEHVTYYATQVRGDWCVSVVKD